MLLTHLSRQRLLPQAGKRRVIRTPPLGLWVVVELAVARRLGLGRRRVRRGRLLADLEPLLAAGQGDPLELAALDA
jgi:hypothetical protein